MASRLHNIRTSITYIHYFRSSSLFYKIFLWILAFILFAGAFNYANLFYVKRTVANQEIDAHNMYFNYNILQLESLLADVKKTAYLLAFDQDVLGLLRVSRQDRNYVYAVKRTLNKLLTFQNTNAGISDIYLYPYATGIIVQGNGTSAADIYFRNRFSGSFADWENTLRSVHQFTVESWRSFRPADSANKPLYDVSDIVVLQTLYDRAQPMGTLVFHLNADYVHGLLRDNNLSGDSVVSVVGGDRIIMSSRPETEGQPYEGNPTSVGGKRIVSEKASGVGDLHYWIETPERTLFRDVNAQFGWINLVLLVFLVFSLLFAFYLTQKIYLPICKMVALLGASGMDRRQRLGKANEIAFIEQNVAEIVTVNRNLNNFVQGSVPLFIEFLLLKMITESPETNGIMEVMSEIGIAFNPGYYAVLVAASARAEEEEEPTDFADKDRLTDLLRAHMSERIVGVLKIGDCRQAVILHGVQPIGIRELGVMLQDEERMANGEFAVRFGLGGSFRNIADIGKSYAQALSAIDNRPIRASSPITEYASDADGRRGDASLPVDAEQRLRNYIAAGSIDQVGSLLNDLFDEQFRRNVPFSEFRQLCVRLQGLVERTAVLDAGIRKEAGYDEERLLGSESAGWLRSEIMRLALEAAERIAGGRSDNGVLEAVFRFIDDHIGEDISLDRVADEVGYSANYLSRYFKLHAGVNFSTHVNMKRIERAKALMADKGKKIKDIAAEVGYASVNNFITTFRKFEGVSPNELRRASLTKERRDRQERGHD